jgi:hypothetical protein
MTEGHPVPSRSHDASGEDVSQAMRCYNQLSNER